jgi:hypothetical protein
LSSDHQDKNQKDDETRNASDSKKPKSKENVGYYGGVVVFIKLFELGVTIYESSLKTIEYWLKASLGFTPSYSYRE